MRIIFFGADPWFSPPVLAALMAVGHQLPVVVTKSHEIVKSIFAKPYQADIKE